MALACVRRPTCEARSAARKASPITYTPPWKYKTTWRGSIPSTVISAVATPPSAAAVTVTSAGSGCADNSSRSSRRCSSTVLPTGKADCRRIASRVSRCSVLMRVSVSGAPVIRHRRIPVIHPSRGVVVNIGFVNALVASVAGGLLERDDLIERLDRAVTKRVTVVSAPPGSGKTSLLRAWADRPASSRRVAFVAVARDQQSAQRFWLAVLDAIGRPPATDDLDAGQLVERVVSDIAGLAEPVVLVVDDLHELRSAEAVAQLEHLLAALPGSARVVFSSRRDPPIRLHRLRLSDEVAEIRAGDLRFTAAETRELLATSGISLSDAGAVALHERTEGWAAGLRLAVISLSGHPDPERFVAEFSGTDRAIGEYLMAEMLERQPGDVQSMLLRTSLVDRVNGELADLLAGRSGSEQILLELEDANAFVVSLDARRTWFRYHQLLTDFLRLELRRTLADEVGDLHRRAAQWFADRGKVVEAVRHTLAAGDWPHAARLVADQSFRWVLDGQARTIDTVLQAFPEGASADHPDLALVHAASELNHGRLEEAAAQLTLAESHVQSAPPARRRRLAVAIASLRLAMARRSGQFTQVIEQLTMLDASIADEAR